MTGGRWYEADVNVSSNGLYDITFYDGDKGSNYTENKISPLGEKSEEGDVVLSYRTGSSLKYAFIGHHEKTEGDKIWVKYEDGVTYKEEKTYVHKLVNLHSLQEGDFQLHFTKIILQWYKYGT